MIAAVQTEDNQSLLDLAADINRALVNAGITRVTAYFDSDNHLCLQGNDTVRAIRLTPVTAGELGFTAVASSHVVFRAGTSLPANGVLSNDAIFTVRVNGKEPQAVTVAKDGSPSPCMQSLRPAPSRRTPGIEH